MSDMVIAANPGDGIRVTVYGHGGLLVAQVKLSWRRAALLGADLVALAVNESQSEAHRMRSDKNDYGK